MMPKFLWFSISLIMLFVIVIVIEPVTGAVRSQSDLAGSNASVSASKSNFDPLSEDEGQQVLTAALSGAPLQAAGAGQDAAPRREVLLVERHHEAKGSPADLARLRRGDAYIYDYDSDTLLHSIVNLKSGAVDEVVTAQGVQLPLTQREIARALEMAYVNPTFRETVETLFYEIAGSTLQSLDQLEVRAFVFHARSMLGNIVPEAESCGINRCAQLLLYTSDDIAFEIVPVVNLSQQTVLPEVRARIETASAPEPLLDAGALQAASAPSIANSALITPTLPCSGDYLIEETLPTATEWHLCWNHSPDAGIVLSDIYVTTATSITHKVLAQANLAQIQTVYNDDSARHYHVTDDGLGGANLVALTAADCPGGTLLQHNGTNVFCKLIEDRGYIYRHDNDQRQGSRMRLFSVSEIDAQVFIVQWDFYDDGTIVPAIGNTGTLNHYGTDPQYGWAMDASNTTIGVGYVNDYYWRLDFDIAANGANDVVEEFNVTPTVSRTRKALTVTHILTETARAVDTELKRSWRVRDDTVTNADNHSISYHIEPLWIGNRYVGPASEPWTQHDIYFTRDNPCEQFVSGNPQSGGCGENVTDFTDAESIAAADVVVWYRVSYRHLPRSEDEPYILTHWDGFSMIPRDWTAVNPLD